VVDEVLIVIDSQRMVIMRGASCGNVTVQSSSDTIMIVWPTCISYRGPIWRSSSWMIRRCDNDQYNRNDNWVYC
jgi:hypothetical protein